MGIEWIDDSTAVFVFSTKTAARKAFNLLTKPSTTPFTSEDDSETYHFARSIPVEIWPPDKRVVTSLVGEAGESALELGLRGTIHMRWARTTDVKRMRAGESEFYKVYGKDGKGGGKRQRGMDDVDVGARRRGGDDDETLRQALDEELDAFLADDAGEANTEGGAAELAAKDVVDVPLSRMRSDFIGSDGRSVLKQSEMLDKGLPVLLIDRMASTGIKPSRRGGDRWEKTAPEQRERRRGGGAREDRGGRRERREPGKKNERQPKTQAQLDEELDAFLNSR